MSEDREINGGAGHRGHGLMSFKEFLAETVGVRGEKRTKNRWKPSAAEILRRTTDMG